MASTMWIINFALLCGLFWLSEAAVFHALGNNPNNDGCVVGSKKYAPGEFWYQPGECVRYECGSSQGDYSGASCGVVMGPKECKISKEDNTKIYPECCPRVICPGDNGV